MVPLALLSLVPKLIEVGSEYFKGKGDTEKATKLETVTEALDLLTGEAETNPELKARLLEHEEAVLKEETKRYQAWSDVAKADASSQDSYTSRARPTGLYMGYIVILFLFICAPVLQIKITDFLPKDVINFFLTVWATAFTGYSVLRTKEKGIKLWK